MDLSVRIVGLKQEGGRWIGYCTDPSPGVDQGQSQTYGGTHQGRPKEESPHVDHFGHRQAWASPSMGVARCERRQVWASTGWDVSHPRGTTRYSKSMFWLGWWHPPIPTGREDRGGGVPARGHGTDEEASGPGTSEQ